MRTVGIDLSARGEHKAVIVDEAGRFVSAVFRFSTTPASLKRLLEIAQENNPDQQVQAVMEPTGMAWFPVAVFLIRQGVTVYLVNSQQVADLRKYFKKHAKSDRIDARVLAKLPFVDEEKLHRLELSTAETLACQRGCKQLERLMKQSTACQNRLIALDRFAWPGLEELVFSDLFSPSALWFREHWYSPQRVWQAGAETIRQNWLASGLASKDSGEWIDYLVPLAEQILDIYGEQGAYLDYELVQAEAIREQSYLAFVEQMHHRLQLKTVRPLYRQLHPSRNLETIPGVGQDGAAVYLSFIGNPRRFTGLRELRGWSGMVPNSKQSASSEVAGLKITQAGPGLIKKFAFLDANAARQCDPQIAALYYDQMVHRGKHHVQALCTCSAHLLDRVGVVLREDRPYQLQDVDGSPITPERARQIIAERYTVPEEIRKRNSKAKRRERTESQAEKKYKRGKAAPGDSGATA
jgi:transposase